MELDAALTFMRDRKQGVLTTIRRDGRPQLSNIVYTLDDTGTFRISVTADRAKAKNLARDPRGSLYVLGENFWAFAVVDGPAELSPVATDPNDAGGDGFDLAALGVTQARFVRIRDSGKNRYGPPSGGFDLDAIAIVHAILVDGGRP